MKFIIRPLVAWIPRNTAIILAACLAVLPARAAFDLVNLGTNTFTVDGGATTATYSQTTNALVFTNATALGDTLGGLFSGAPQDWSLYSNFGLRMTLTGVNPGLPFTVEFYDADIKIINSYQGSTAGVSLTPTVVMLGLSLAGNDNFSQVVGMQFTWDGVGAINTRLTEVVGFEAPASEGFFVVRAPGGVRFLTGTNDVAGIRLTPDGAWSTLSDRNAKTRITAIDPQELLQKVAALPVTAWQYKHDPNRRYLGPMAQDFHEAFGLGHDDKHLSTLDTDGVTLAALKGLIAEWQKRQDRSAAQARRLQELEAELERLQKLVPNLPPAE